MAITAALLIGLGFPPLQASGLSLIANTAPVAYRALGTPIVALAGVTGLDLHQLSAMVGRQLPFFSILVPFWLIAVFCGWRKMLEIWPAAQVFRMPPVSPMPAGEAGDISLQFSVFYRNRDSGSCASFWLYDALQPEKNAVYLWENSQASAVFTADRFGQAGPWLYNQAFRDGCYPGAGFCQDRGSLSFLRDPAGLAGGSPDLLRYFLQRAVRKPAENYCRTARAESSSDGYGQQLGGGVMGKMIDAQSIGVASTATRWYGYEGRILRYVFWHSLVLAALVALLVFLQAYVYPLKYRNIGICFSALLAG